MPAVCQVLNDTSTTTTNAITGQTVSPQHTHKSEIRSVLMGEAKPETHLQNRGHAGTSLVILGSLGDDPCSSKGESHVFWGYIGGLLIPPCYARKQTISVNVKGSWFLALFRAPRRLQLAHNKRPPIRLQEERRDSHALSLLPPFDATSFQPNPTIWEFYWPHNKEAFTLRSPCRLTEFPRHQGRRRK